MRNIVCIVVALVSALGQGQLTADWQLVVSNSVTGGFPSTGDLIVSKVQGNRMRTDYSTTFSILSYADKPEQIQLFHINKAYQRQSIQNVSSPPSRPPPRAEKTTMDAQPTELFSWTNGMETGRVWVAPITRFVKSPTDTLPSTAPQPNPTTKVPVGSLFGSNRIVVSTEYTGAIAMPQPTPEGAAGSQAKFTNLTYKVTSKLISLTETNLHPWEFEIPDGYKDLAGQPSPSVPDARALFGNHMIGADNMQGRRKEFERGRPVLVAPKVPAKP